jgi:hypothetical protein
MGSNGHNDTVKYLVKELEALDGYYKVETQKFTALVQTNGTWSLAINTVSEPSGLFEYSPSGNISAALVVVSNLGCDPVCLPRHTDTWVGQTMAHQKLVVIFAVNIALDTFRLVKSCIKPLDLRLYSVIGVPYDLEPV